MNRSTLPDPNRAISTTGYYGLPVIHRPHWKWLVIGYFFLGGISGSSAAIGAVIRFAGGSHSASAPLARVATYVSLGALLPCPILLIWDLGRPARFLNMLRTFRWSSPMSVGTWALTAFGGLITLSAAAQFASDRKRSGPRTPRTEFVSRWLALFTGVFGLLVAGYTGALLAATAVPLWSKNPGIMGPLFLSSAMTSGAAAISLASAARGSADAAALEQLHDFETLSVAAEGLLLMAWLAALGSTAKPLNQGLLGYVVRYGVGAAGLFVPLLLAACAHGLPRHAAVHRRALNAVASTLTLAGGLALRYAVVEGGRQSADDPMATFDLTS